MSEKNNKSKLEKSLNTLGRQNHKQQAKPNAAAGANAGKYKRGKKNQQSFGRSLPYQNNRQSGSRRQNRRKPPKQSQPCLKS